MEGGHRLAAQEGPVEAAKKAGRVAAEGLVGWRSRRDGKTAPLIELNAETDFVARNEHVPGRRRARSPQSRWTATGDSKRSAAERSTGESDRGELITAPDRHDRREHDAAPRRRADGRARARSAPTCTTRRAPDLGRIGVLVALEGAGDQAVLRSSAAARHARRRRQPAVAVASTTLDPAASERERAILAEQAAAVRQAAPT